MMAEKIKQFFQKKKMDVKFSKAGEGHRLDEDTRSHHQPTSHVQTHRKPPGEASRTAGIAALTRLESIEKPETIVKPTLRMDMKSSPTSSPSASKITSDQQKKYENFSEAGKGHRLDEDTRFHQHPNTHVQSDCKPPGEASRTAGIAALTRLESNEKPETIVKPILRMDMKSSTTFSHEMTKDKQYQASGGSSSFQDQRPLIQVSDSSLNIAVYMICPVCHQSVRRPEFKVHIKQCLHEEYLKEPLTASVQMIHTLAVNEEKKKLCVDTLCRYLDNIITNPNEEKFRKIRANNKGFKERIECVTGGVLFLEAIGFIKELLPHQDNEEYFYVLPESKASCIDELIVWKEVLTSAETLKPHLDRNPQLLRPSGQVNKFELPDEFFNMSVDEIKREQRVKTEALERESMLRTKAMREKDELKSAIKYYRFVLLRIRFPEQFILQGVFRPLELLSDVRQFISECLLDPSREYSLVFLKNTLFDDTANLAQCGMAPSAMLNLSWSGGEDSLGFPAEQIFKPELFCRLKSV